MMLMMIRRKMKPATQLFCCMPFWRLSNIPEGAEKVFESELETILEKKFYNVHGEG